MKKQILILAALALAFAACKSSNDPDAPFQLTVATFENYAGGINVAHADTCWQGANAPQEGANKWLSGTYMFTTNKANWGGFTAFTVTNETSNTSTGMTAPYRSASGGAYAGNNFVVWADPYSTDAVVKFTAHTVPGFFVNNSAYAVNSMCNGDGYAKKFGQDDYFVLYCIGWKSGALVDTVKVYMAKDGEYINQWTYVDLSTLGKIDAMSFQMWGNDITTYDGQTYYLNTPAYFCMDNFGEAKPADYIEPARGQFQ
ncbi:MAG: DUF4465 domain-containing protein [Paludibacteraceae bacterium]|nr:DUF4465 domain-containing protein [Paludibacteraceae bacterium]